MAPRYPCNLLFLRMEAIAPDYYYADLRRAQVKSLRIPKDYSSMPVCMIMANFSQRLGVCVYHLLARMPAAAWA